VRFFVAWTAVNCLLEISVQVHADDCSSVMPLIKKCEMEWDQTFQVSFQYGNFAVPPLTYFILRPPLQALHYSRGRRDGIRRRNLSRTHPGMSTELFFCMRINYSTRHVLTFNSTLIATTRVSLQTSAHCFLDSLWSI
jgi:hypothetical protein